MLTFIQDRPSDVVWPYTNANVVAGRFNYSFSPAKARHNIIEVRFIDPDNGWKTSIEQVTDDAWLLNSVLMSYALTLLDVRAEGKQGVMVYGY